MIALFLTTTITCSQAQGLLSRIQNQKNVPNHVKHEIIEEIKQVIPTCPVKIKTDGK
jgi:uncharacterized protein (UPF0147 family)